MSEKRTIDDASQEEWQSVKLTDHQMPSAVTMLDQAKTPGVDAVAAGWGLRVCPMSIKAAARYVAQHHRHNRPPQGGLFAAGARRGAQLVGVVIVGRPVARLLDDGQTAEVTRLCTDGTPNTCSLLYGAAARAARALGYSSIITYTLASEPGVSLRAAGWSPDGSVAAANTWSRPSRSRVQTDLFGEATRPTEAKQRWRKQLSAGSPDQSLRAHNNQLRHARENRGASPSVEPTHE